jgi:hypothetical protein
MQTQPVEERKSWLVGSVGDAPLAPLLERISQDPDAHLLRTVGPSGSPRLLVVEMAETTVARYRQEFGDEYLFEENAPLHPLEDSGGGPVGGAGTSFLERARNMGLLTGEGGAPQPAAAHAVEQPRPASSGCSTGGGGSSFLERVRGMGLLP